MRGSFGIICNNSRSRTYNSKWSVPRWAATALANGASLNVSCSNPMLNVLTARLLCDCINATTREESIPPERKAPQRDVGDHLPANGSMQQFTQLFLCILF